MKENIEFRQIRDFGTIISDTFLFIKQNFAPLAKTFFTICGLFIVAGIVSMALQKLRANNISTNYGGENIFYATMRASILTWEYALLMVVSIINYVSMYVAILSYVAVYIRKGNMVPSTEEVWEQFKVYFFRMLGSSLVLAIFMMLCFLACIIPGIYIFPAMTLFYPIMILEDGSFSHSFSRAFKLLKDEWWVTAAVIFVVYIICYMMTFVIQIPAAIITFAAAISHGEKILSTGYTIVVAIFTYIAQIMMIIPIISSAFIYFNLVERKENSGLLNRINTLGQQPTDHNSHLEEY
jgi:hypothetical protein